MDIKTSSKMLKNVILNTKIKLHWILNKLNHLSNIVRHSESAMFYQDHGLMRSWNRSQILNKGIYLLHYG